MFDLDIVHYCHPCCTPLQSITRLPKAEAFAQARAFAAAHAGTAFGRFADFENYYPLRIRTEAWLHERFTALGGQAATRHPLYFVLEGSDFLHGWFDQGGAIRLPLRAVDAGHTSFTLGDSAARMDRPDREDPFLLDTLLALIGRHGGVAGFLAYVGEKYTYVEAQLWCEDCLAAVRSEHNGGLR